MPEESKKKRAVALRYDSEQDPAPRVVAKGRGAIAQKILEIARENEIPIHEDADLVEILAALDLGELIPEKMYSAIAEILSFLYRVNGKARRNAV